jgi:hypothetical protein
VISGKRPLQSWQLRVQHGLAVTLDDQAISIMFDLVDPLCPGRDCRAPRRDAGFEDGFTNARKHRQVRGEMRIRNGPSGGVSWGPITVSRRLDGGLGPEVGNGLVSSQTVPISPPAL